MSIESTGIQDKLIAIWEREVDEGDLTHDFDFVLEILKNQNSPPRILKMTVQVIERFCTNYEFRSFIKDGGFQSLIDLIRSSSEKPLRIMAAQSVSRIAQAALKSDADGLLTAVDDLLQLDSIEPLVSRPLRDASESLKHILSTDENEDRVHDDTENEEGDKYDPEYADEEAEEEGEETGRAAQEGEISLGMPFGGTNDELLKSLSSDMHDTLKAILSQMDELRWLEIRGRLKNFFLPNITAPDSICKHMRMGPMQVQKLLRLSGLSYMGRQPISAADFSTLCATVSKLADEDFHKAAIAFFQIDESTIPSSRGRRAPMQTPTEKPKVEENSSPRGEKAGSVTRNARGDIIQHDDATSFLLLRNLPLDTSAQELLPLLRKYSECVYLDVSDIVLPSTARTPRAKLQEVGAHAYVNFRHIRDARKAKLALSGQTFGGRVIEIDYSIGKPTNKVWIGGIPAELTRDMIFEYMSQFGQIEPVDIKRRGQGDAFAFAVFGSVEEAMRAVRALDGAKNTINGHVVRIGYNSTKTEVDDRDRDRERGRDRDRPRDRERDEDPRDRERSRDFPRENERFSERERPRDPEPRVDEWDRPASHSRGTVPFVDRRDNPRRASFDAPPERDNREYPRDRQSHGSYADDRDYARDGRPVSRDPPPRASFGSRDDRDAPPKRRYDDSHEEHYSHADRAPAHYDHRDARGDGRRAPYSPPAPPQYDDPRPRDEYVRSPQGYSPSIPARYPPYDEPYSRGLQYRDASHPPPPDYPPYHAYDSKRPRHSDGYADSQPPLPRGPPSGYSSMQQPTSRSYAPPPPSRPRPPY